jgi:hypothetical protein
MSAPFYLVVHLTGVILLFIGLGSALMPEDTPQRKVGLRFHGLGLVLLLVGGFGLVAKLKTGFDWWVIVKLVLWFGFGAMPIIGKRGLLPTPLAWTIAVVCGIVAIVLGTTHGAVGAMFAS